MTSLFVLSFIAVMAIGLPPQNSKLNIQHQNADNIIAETRNENGEISPVYESDLIESNSTSTSFFSPDFEDYISPTLIFGEDERTLLDEEDYTKFPYRTICLVHALYDFNNDGITDSISIGTGVLVAPSTILTAAHVIFDNSRGIWSYTVEVYPGGHKNSSGTIVAPYGKFHSVYVTRGNNYETNDSADDWAIIDLNDDIGSEIGYMGVSSELSNGDTVRLYGYHGDYDSRLGYGPGTTSGVSTYKFRHNCDAIAGSSGGPITRGSTTVVGIHSGGYNSNWDQACKVSNYIVGWIEERIEGL